MGIQVEFNPDLALRDISEYKAGRRQIEEWVPDTLFLILYIVCTVTGGFCMAIDQVKEQQFFDQDAATFVRSIDRLIHNNAERFVNGVVLVAKGEQIVYEKCLGTLDHPSASTQFLIGSISKQFTAALMLRLVDQGLINLEAPIKTYLSDLVDEWANTVSIKCLLNHTSGIIGLGRPLEFSPGTKFKYSPTLAYSLCSQIAEKVMGMPFELIMNRWLQSIGLQNIGMVFAANQKENREKHPVLIKGFSENKTHIMEEVSTLGEDGHIFDKSWVPGGGLFASARSLLQWNLKLHGGEILSKKSYEKMIEPSATRVHPRYGTIGYGLGVQLVDQDGFLEISHSGYLDGYISTCLYYPSNRISVIVLENVSWDLTDVRRAFSFHDHLRDFIRGTLKQ